MSGFQSTNVADDFFSVFVPGAVEIVEKSEGQQPGPRKIGGFCSTEGLDRQGEIVVQKGLDFSEFVRYGFYNDNHKQDTAAVLGYPTLAEPRNGKWWTEGNLIEGYPPADRIWELAKALDSTPRKLGFSIEGKVIERDGRNKILRAIVRNVAITSCPVNLDCSFGVLAKAFASIDDVVRAVERAGTRTERVERDLEVDFSGAVERVKRRWPHLSAGAVQRAATFAFLRT